MWRRKTNYQCVVFEQDRLLVFHTDSPGIMGLGPARRKTLVDIKEYVEANTTPSTTV